MKNIALALFSLLIVAPLIAAPDSAAAGAETLVRAMRSDELAVSTAKRAFASGAVEGYAGASAGCLKRVDYRDFTARFSRVVDQVLTPSEIETALTFYQSTAGVKFVEGTFRRLRASLGEDSWLPKIAGVEDISPEERDAISAFASSDLGRKIAGKQMTESPAARQFGRDMVEEIGQKCSKPKK
jgi:ubiquitin